MPVFRPDSNTEREGEGNCWPIVGIMRNAYPCLVFLLDILRFFDQRHILSDESVQGLVDFLFCERLMRAPLRMSKDSLREFVFHLVPRACGYKEHEAWIAEKVSPPLAQDFADEDVRVYDEAKTIRDD